MSGIRIRRHRAVRHRTAGTPTTSASAASFLGAIEADSIFIMPHTTTAVTSSSFTPALGELLVVKASSNVATVSPAAISGGGLTWSQLLAAGNATAPVVLWAAAVTSSTVMSVTVTYTSSESSSTRTGVFVVERFIGGHLAATPAISTVSADTTSPYQATLTTTAANSVVTWIAADYNGVNGTVTYVGAPTQTYRYQQAVAGALSFSTAYQPAPAAGAQTYGLSAPAGQNVTLGAVEILAGLP